MFNTSGYSRVNNGLGVKILNFILTKKKKKYKTVIKHVNDLFKVFVLDLCNSWIMTLSFIWVLSFKMKQSSDFIQFDH